MNLIKTLILAGLLTTQSVAFAAAPATPAPSTTNSNISTDLLTDGSFSATKTYAGSQTFTDNYTFNLTTSLLEKFDSLSTTLNYTNTSSVGCALLIFCGSSTTGFNNLSLTVSSATSTTTASNSTSSSSSSVVWVPILFWSSTTSSANTLSTNWIDLLSAGTYKISVAGTALSNGGTYALGVTAVPEPESVALTGLGLGVLGFVARRRLQNTKRTALMFA